MKIFSTLFLLSVFWSSTSHASIVERRIWIDSAAGSIKDELCGEKIKTWRCLFPKPSECKNAVHEAFSNCSGKVLPDLPEYIQDEASKNQANQVVVGCLNEELARKHVISLPREKLDEYNICTGSVQKAKTLPPNLQKALDFSKSQTGGTCANGAFYRKCYNLSENFCMELLGKKQMGCVAKMEDEGVSVKSDDSSIQDAGKKITDCSLQELRKDLDVSRKRIKDKDCD